MLGYCRRKSSIDLFKHPINYNVTYLAEL